MSKRYLRLQKHKHLRGRHDQLDHAWNRGMGGGGAGGAVTGGLSKMMKYRQTRAALLDMVRTGDMTRNEAREQLRAMRETLGDMSPTRREEFATSRTTGGLAGITQSQVSFNQDLVKNIKQFQEKRNNQRLPYNFDPTQYTSQMSRVEEGASGVQEFEIDGKPYYYRRTPIFAGSRNRGVPDVERIVENYWFSLPSYYMPLIADSIAGAMGVNVAPVSQMTNQGRVVASQINFDAETGVIEYLDSLLQKYEDNPTQENYDEYVNSLEPMVVINTITGNVDAKYDNTKMIDNREDAPVGGKKFLMSFDFDYAGSNPKYTGKYFEPNDILIRYAQFKSKHGKPGEKFLSSQMEDVLKEMPNTLQWNEAIPDYARQQILNRIENLLAINASTNVDKKPVSEIIDSVVEKMQEDSKEELSQRSDAENIRNHMIYLQSNQSKLVEGMRYLDKNLAIITDAKGDDMALDELEVFFGEDYSTLMNNAQDLHDQILKITNDVFSDYDNVSFSSIQQQIQLLMSMISSSPLIRRSRDFSKYVDYNYPRRYRSKEKKMNRSVFEKIQELRMNSINRRLKNLTYKAPLNYGAAVGEIIQGQLGRGAGGRFANAAEIRRIAESNDPLSLFGGSKKRMFQTIYNAFKRPTPLTDMLNKSQSLVSDLLKKKNGQWDDEVQQVQNASDELWRLETGFKRNMITGDSGIKPTGVSVRIEGLNSDKNGDGQSVAEMIPGLNDGEPAESYAEGIGKRMAQDAYDYLSVFNQRGDFSKFNGKQPEFNLTRLPEGQKFKINEEALKNGEIKIDFNFNPENPKGPTRDEINDALSDVMMKMDPNIEAYAKKFMDRNPEFAVGADGQPKDLLQQAMASLMADPQKMAEEHPELMKFAISAAHGVDLFEDGATQPTPAPTPKPTPEPPEPTPESGGNDWSDTDPGLEQKPGKRPSGTQSGGQPAPVPPPTKVPEYIAYNGPFDADPNDQFANWDDMRNRYPETESALPAGQNPPPGFIRAGYGAGPTGRYGASGLNPNDTWYNPQTGETWKPDLSAINNAVANSGTQSSTTQSSANANANANTYTTATPAPTPNPAYGQNNVSSNSSATATPTAGTSNTTATTSPTTATASPTARTSGTTATTSPTTATASPTAGNTGSSSNTASNSQDALNTRAQKIIDKIEPGQRQSFASDIVKDPASAAKKYNISENDAYMMALHYRNNSPTATTSPTTATTSPTTATASPTARTSGTTATTSPTTATASPTAGTSGTTAGASPSQSLSRKLNWFGSDTIMRTFSQNPEAAIRQYDLTNDEVRELRNMLPNMP